MKRAAGLTLMAGVAVGGALATILALPIAAKEARPETILPHGPASAAQAEGDLVPLPRDCKGINPPGQPEVTCCAFGYVISDGVTLAGVVVRLESASVTAVATTTQNLSSDQPYYHFSLSDLGIVEGDTITLSVEYGGRSRTVVYPRLARGGQQIDVVLSAPGREDSWQVYASGVFSTLHGLALDQGLIWLAGAGPASIAQLSMSGALTLLDNPLPAPIYRDTRAIVLDVVSDALTTVTGKTAIIANYGGGVSFYTPFFPWVTQRVYNAPISSNYLRDMKRAGDGSIWAALKPQASSAVYSVTMDNRVGLLTDIGIYQEDLWNSNCVGVNNTMITTTSRTPPHLDDIDWGRWKLPAIPSSGEYEVFAHLPWMYKPLYETTSARYVITHENGVAYVVVNQLDSLCEWASLGRYHFASGSTTQAVKLGDYTGDDPARNIIYDAVKWRHVASGAEYVVDESDSTYFQRTAGFWRYTSLEGKPFYGCRPPNGNIHWMRSAPTFLTADSGRMIWQPNLVHDGNYRVEVTSPKLNLAYLLAEFSTWQQTTQARWKVHSQRGLDVITSTQQVSDGCAFQSLGVYPFSAGSAGGAGDVELGNFTGENPRTVIIGDAVRWTYLEEESIGGLMQRAPSGLWITYTVGNAPILSNDMWAVLPAPNGDVWAAGAGGLNLRLASGAWLTFTTLNSGLPFTTPTALALDPTGALWVASRFGGGLAMLDAARLTWHVFAVGDGLPFDRIAAMATNGVGGVYIGSADGAGLALRKPAGDWIVFTPASSPLPGGIVNGIAVQPDGVVWVAATAAISAETTAVARLTPGKPPIVTMNSVKPNNPIQGDPERGIITFRASGLDQDEGGADIARYEWRIERLPGFVTTTAQFRLPASALPPGLNTVTVRAFDDEGVTSAPSTLATLNVNAKQTWLVMLYLAGDNDLDDRLASALARLNAITTTLPPNVTIVAQFDGRGVNDTSRHVFRSNATPIRASLSERAMNQANTLRDFIVYAREQAPNANAAYLVIADHGRGTDGIGLDEANGNTMMTPAALREALRQATQDGAIPIDVLHLDACLMAMIEQAAEVAPYARYLVASQNLSYSAFAWDHYVQLIDLATDGYQLAVGVAVSYAHIISDASLPYTISALDLGAAPSATQALADFALAVAVTLPGQIGNVRQARAIAQHFDSLGYYTIDGNDEYLDLADFAGEVAARVAVPEVISAAARLRAVITSSLVITSVARSGEYPTGFGHAAASGWNLDRARGVSVFLPPGYCSEYADYFSGALFSQTPAAWRLMAQQVAGQASAVLCPSGLPPVDGLQDYRVFVPVAVRSATSATGH